MKYYLSILKNNAIIAYRTSKNYNINFIFMILGSVLTIFMSYFLWSAVYMQTKMNSTGFEYKEVFVYILLTGIISFIVNQDTSFYVSQEIKDGSIVYSLLRPYAHIWQHFANSVGRAIFYIKYICSWLILVLLIYCYFYEIQLSIIHVLISILSIIQSFIIIFIFNYLIGLASYITMNNWGSEKIKGLIISFLSGELVPLFMVPTSLLVLFKVTPFYYTIYFSVCIFMNKLSVMNILVGLIIQLLWIIIFYCLYLYFWKKVERYIQVNGG